MDDAVKSTSDWMAAVRTHETARADRYLRDPYAQLLAGPDSEAQFTELRELRSPVDVVIVRGRFGDEALIHALDTGIRQVVSLGAGSDTRGYRLDLPEDLVLYEIDLPGQLAAKHRRLAAAGIIPQCRVAPVETDLRGDWTTELDAAGHQPARPTAWIAEGLFYYLDHPTADNLLRQLTERSAPGSVLVFDIPDEDYLTDPNTQAFLDRMVERGSPFIGFTTDPAGWLDAHGWRTEAYLPESLNQCPWLPDVPSRLLAGYRHIWHVHGILDPASAHGG